MACAALLAGIVSSTLALDAAAQSNQVAGDLETRVAAARAATKLHGQQIRIGLLQALKDAGGPKGAIGACTSLAPEVNDRMADTSGFDISRTALKVRNPENAPDDWERATLEQFVKDIASGSDPKSLEAYHVETTAEGQKLFRYMRPIIMSEVCLSCHGPNVAPDVRSEIARAYNDDKAIGFNLGDLRGAFSAMQVMD